MTRESLQVNGRQPLRMSKSRLWWVVPAAAIAATLLNLLVRSLAPSLIEIPADFVPLSTSSIVALTIIGVVGAALAFVAVAHFSTQPRRGYLKVVLAALLVVAIPNLAIGLNPGSFSFRGATLPIALLFVLLHVTTALVCLLGFAGLALRPAEMA